MEHRYHPLIYKQKGKEKPLMKKEDVIEKKLTNPPKKDKDRESNIESYVNKEV